MKWSRCGLRVEVAAQHLFDIGGNKLLLIAVVHHQAQRLFIQQVLDPTAYDRSKWRE
ncbi:MAG: type II toxin-antitoxin system HigB family toxin [Pseudomonadota bacterium]